MLDVEDVSALKTMELELGKLYQSVKEVLSGHGQKNVDVKNETSSHKRGPILCQETQGRASLRLSRSYTPSPTIYLPNLGTSLDFSCEHSVGIFYGIVYNRTNLRPNQKLRICVS